MPKDSQPTTTPRRSQRKSGSSSSRSGGRSQNPVRERASLASITSSPNSVAPSSDATSGSTGSQQSLWSTLRRVQSESHNLTTFCPLNGVKEVPYPCSPDGVQVPASLFWKAPNILDFKPLRCFHNLLCTTFKDTKPGLYSGHYIASCKKWRSNGCGYWVSITIIARNIHGDLDTEICRALEPTFDAQIRQALEASTRAYEAENDSRSPNSPPRSSTPPPTPESPRSTLTPLLDSDDSDSSTSTLLSSPSPQRDSQPVVLQPVFPEVSNGRHPHARVIQGARQLASPLSVNLRGSTRSSSPDSVDWSPISPPLRLSAGPIDADGLADDTVFRLAMGKPITFREMVDTFWRCYQCGALLIHRFKAQHLLSCSPEETLLRQESYESVWDTVFDMAATTGIPVVTFCRFWKVCDTCRTIQPVADYATHVCDLTL